MKRNFDIIQLKEIDEHCSDLSSFLSGWDMQLYWPDLCDWLHVASGIVKVEFDVIRFESGFGWCSNADEFSLSREEILQKYITELTRFTYVWSALESLINDINPEKAHEKGKINSICFYLKNRLGPTDNILPYTLLLKQLHSLLSKSEVNEPKILNRFEKIPHVSSHGRGIYVIYKLRNLFLHGSLNFPFPDGENKPNSSYPELVNLSTRIVLLTIQMILMAHYVDSDIKTTYDWEWDDEMTIPLNELLGNIHFKEEMITKND